MQETDVEEPIYIWDGLAETSYIMLNSSYFVVFFSSPGVPAPLATTPSTSWRSAYKNTTKINGMEPSDPQRQQG